jgi:deferrochelatase/peroxidase EfeB
MAKVAPQSGITNRPPEHLLLAALSFAERSRAGVEAALDALSDLLERELNSELDPVDTESGELGFADDYDRAFLTVTLGLAAPVYDLLETPAEQRPADLRPIPWAQLGDSPTNEASGDFVLQICADNLYVCEHVLRRVQHDLGDKLTLVYSHIGSQRYNSRPGRTSKREGRALIGFLDGTSNLDPRSSEADAELVFVDPEKVDDYPQNPSVEPPPDAVSPYGGSGEPGRGPHFPPDLAPVPAAEPKWAEAGTYMTVRASTFPATAWDAIPQADQQQAIGRFKRSGVSLDLPDGSSPTDPPAFASEKDNLAVALRAHIRKANPRGGSDDEKRRIFRRGYPLIDSADGGELRRGLIFIAFARTLSTQFEFIVRGWMRNESFPEPGTGNDALLFEKLGEQVLGGGYYFVPPLREKSRPWAWRYQQDA